MDLCLKQIVLFLSYSKHTEGQTVDGPNLSPTKQESHLIAWSYNLMSQILEILAQVFHTSSIQCYQPVSLIIYLFLIISDTKSQ